jgi:hypothetical protein
MRSLFLVAFLINVIIISAFKLQIKKNILLRIFGTELYAIPNKLEDKLYYETTGEVDDRCGYIHIYIYTYICIHMYDIHTYMSICICLCMIIYFYFCT